MHTLAIDRGFLADLAQLEKPDARAVLEAFDEFGAASQPDQVLKSIIDACNPRYRSIAIRSTWLAIVLAPETGQVYTALRVLPTDEATRWAQRTDVSVNPATGGIEFRDDAAVAEGIPELQAAEDSAAVPLFSHISDEDLTRIGIDDKTLQFARALTTEDQLYAAKHILPGTQWEALHSLAAGDTPDEVLAELGVTNDDPVDLTDLDAAVLRSANRVALVEDQDELLKAFAYPFATWRVYLHPSQRRIAEATFSGPARVTGGPGTGKTIVALHRAHNLAKRGAGRVLLTTFTTNLAEALRSGLDYIVDDSPHKQSLYTPGGHIPVVPSDRLAETRPDSILILPWNLAEPIIRANPQVRDWGAQWYVPLPWSEISV